MPTSECATSARVYYLIGDEHIVCNVHCTGRLAKIETQSWGHVLSSIALMHCTAVVVQWISRSSDNVMHGIWIYCCGVLHLYCCWDRLWSEYERMIAVVALSGFGLPKILSYWAVTGLLLLEEMSYGFEVVVGEDWGDKFQLKSTGSCRWFWTVLEEEKQDIQIWIRRKRLLFISWWRHLFTFEMRI